MAAERQNYFEVDTCHDLWKNMKFAEPVAIGDFSFSSVNEIHQRMCLAQHHYEHQAGLGFPSEWADNPAQISVKVRHFLEKRKVDYSASWIFMQEAAMFRACLQLVRQRDNPFYRSMRRHFDEFGDNLKYVAVTSTPIDRLWCSGLKPPPRHYNRPQIESNNMPGVNLYGDVLTKVYRYFFLDEPPTDLTKIPGYDNCVVPDFEQFFTEDLSGEVSFKRTCASVSDSIWRNIKAIEGGCIFYESGATAGRLADLLSENFVVLNDYRFVIFTATTNDSYQSSNDQVRSFEKLKGLIRPLRSHPQTRVVFNLGFDIPAWPKVRAYNNWFTEKFSHELAAPNFEVINWADQSYDNRLVDIHRREVPRYFEPPSYGNNGRVMHPNELGVKEMWSRIHKRYPMFKELRLLQMKTHPEIWRHLMLSQVEPGKVLMRTPLKPPGMQHNNSNKKDQAGPSHRDREPSRHRKEHQADPPSHRSREEDRAGPSHRDREPSRRRQEHQADSPSHCSCELARKVIRRYKE